MMSLFYAQGVRVWSSGDAVGTTYTETCQDVRTGVQFQPKAIRAVWMGLGTGSNGGSNTVHLRCGGGFAVSPTSRRCVFSQSQDNVGTQVCTVAYRDDAVVGTCTSTPAVDGLLDLDAMLSTGFRWVVDAQAPVNIAVLWQAWGGDAITVAQVGEIAEPAATGNQSYTVSGFTSDGGGQVVMFFGGQGTGAAPSVARNDAGLMVGFTTGLAGGENVHGWLNDDDASGTSDTDRYCVSGECLGMCTVGGGNPSARAVLNAWQTDAFQLNWLARATTNRRYIFLAIKGGAWRAGEGTIDGTTVGASATVSGLPFQPLGVLMFGHMGTEQSSGTSATEGRLAVGAGSSPTNRACHAGWSLNGLATASAIALLERYDAILGYPTSSGGETGRKDLTAMYEDGFRLEVASAGGVASEWFGYLVFGIPHWPVEPEVVFAVGSGLVGI